MPGRVVITVWLEAVPCTQTLIRPLQDLLLAVLLETDEIKLAPNHAEMPSLLARMKPSALVKHVLKQRVRMVYAPVRRLWTS